MAEQEYRPAENVPRSGIYLVLHQRHREPHEAVVLKGAVFPNCKECGDAVRYRLLRSSDSLDGDRDFESGSTESGSGQ